MQKQFCKREREVESAPRYLQIIKLADCGVYQSLLPSHRVCKGLGSFQALAEHLSQEPGMCLCCHGIQLQPHSVER